MILNNIIGFNFIVEYHLEYRSSKHHLGSSVVDKFVYGTCLDRVGFESATNS